MEETNEQLDGIEYLEFIERWKEKNKELIIQKKCKKVFLENLPRWNKNGKAKEGTINWEKSINNLVHFIYGDIESNVKITNYIKDRHPKIIIEYDNKTLDIYIDNFKKCQLGIVLKLRTKEFKYKIGTRFQDKKRDIVIIEREFKPNIHNKGKFLKYYKYKCFLCGWNKGVILESSLLDGVGCSVCGYNSKIVVEDINSIYYTDKWMIPYIGEKCAKTHTRCSNDKVQVTCPDCGRIKKQKLSINNIYYRHSIGCYCSDNISYPEKFMLNILEQLLKNNFIYQYSSKNNKWCNKYKYDFYFMLNEEQYIIETHGKQHYYKNCGWDKLDKTQLNDEFKKELALSNGIKEDNYIIIDCRESNLDWIKQNILSSTLSKIFNLNNIDWFKTEKFTCSNLIKVACEYKKNNPNLTTTQIGDILGHNRSTINRWLKTGSKFNWCEYDTREEKSKISRNSSKNKGKNIIIIKNEKTIGIFHSSHDLSRQSEKLFGTKLDYRNISAVATDRRKFHKGYTFKYVKDLTEDEYIKYDIENKLKELK